MRSLTHSRGLLAVWLPGEPLLAGFEQPGAGAPCLQFVNLAGASTTLVPVDGFGLGRARIALPSSTSFLHAQWMMQAVLDVPLQQWTNGVRITLGRKGCEPSRAATLLERRMCAVFAAPRDTGTLRGPARMRRLAAAPDRGAAMGGGL